MFFKQPTWPIFLKRKYLRLLHSIVYLIPESFKNKFAFSKQDASVSPIGRLPSALHPPERPPFLQVVQMRRGRLQQVRRHLHRKHLDASL
jgi:hypothetical protein